MAINQICDPCDMQLVSFQAVVNDLHRLLQVRKAKRHSLAACKGKGWLEPLNLDIPDWETLLQQANRMFETTRPCVSYGIIFTKPYRSS